MSPPPEKRRLAGGVYLSRRFPSTVGSRHAAGMQQRPKSAADIALNSYDPGMDDLTEQQTDELRQRLEALRTELQAMLHSTREGTRPVALDEPIGRLTRMDAMQQQSMSKATRQQTDLRLRQVEQALGLAERGEYGLCRRCEDPIGYPRLSARPESPYCLDCQDAVDRKHS